MLRTKSFIITDDKGINELLNKYRLAPGSGIMIGGGGLFRKPTVLIPYEDGQPQNAAQRIIEIRELQSKLKSDKGLIEHSQRVLAHLVADAESRIAAADAILGNTPDHAAKRDNIQKKGIAQNALDQLNSQKAMNDHEINRLQVNIDEYDIEIAGLKN